jgi:hypothetical protein
LLRPPADAGIFYQSPDLPPGIVPVFVFMAVIMFVIMFMAAIMFAVFVVMLMVMIMFMVMAVFVSLFMMFVFMLIIVPGNMAGIAAEVHHRVDAGNAPPLVPLEFQLPALYAQFAQFQAQRIGINAQINQGPQGHIPGNTGVTIKM